MQGRFTYTLPGGESKKYSTRLANSTSQDGVLSVSARVYDDYFDWSNKTKFNYNFTWAPSGTEVQSTNINK